MRTLLLVSMLCLLFAAADCAGAENVSAPPLTGDDGSTEAGYSGGGTVVPILGADGAATRDGALPPGAEGGAPCPRDATVASRETGGEAGFADALEGGSPSDGEACPTPLSPGDLRIDELMIASQPGLGDHGEWVEVYNTRDCALDLIGLYAEVPHGMGMTLASVSSDLWLPPHGFFLIADSSEPTQNHGLPGTIVVWGNGTSSDVLKNSGDTLTLYTSTATIDVLTYPSSSKLVEGASMAFPAGCDPSLRAAFGDWQASRVSFSPGFYGTPGAANVDVTCPVMPPPPPPMTSPCGS